MAGFKNDSEVVEQACTRLTTAGGGGGLGARSSPAFANTILAWLVSKNSYAVKGAWGAQQPPRLQRHRSHGEWRGFTKPRISLRQHYLTTTVLTAVIVIFTFMCIFIFIISMCM